MARTIGMEALEQKIERAQMNVVRTKQKYDASIAVLEDLLNKQDALRRDQLVATIMKSSKSYDEIMRFLQEDDDEGEDE